MDLRAQKKFIAYLIEKSKVKFGEINRVTALLGIGIDLDEFKQGEKTDLENFVYLSICELMYIYQFMDNLSNIKDDNKHYIDNFSVLSMYILNSPLKGKEKTSILMDFINYNIKMDLDNSSKFVVNLDLPKLYKHGVKLSELFKLMVTDELDKIFSNNDAELNNHQLKIKKLLIKSESQQEAITSDIRDSHNIIKEHYFDKKDSFNFEDIEVVINALKFLKVDEELCNIVNAILNNEVEKRLQKEKSSKSEAKPLEKTVVKSKYISDQEYKQIRKELNSYVDVYTLMPKRLLSEEELIYCGDLLLKINIEPNFVKTLFVKNDKIKKEQKTSTVETPLAAYKRNYDKYKYYEKEYKLTRNMEVINQYIEALATADEEDSLVWTEGIAEEMKKINNIIPADGSYGLHKVIMYHNRKKD